MFRDNGNRTPHEEIGNTVAEITAPWQQAGMKPPYLGVLEVARASGLSEQVVVHSVLDDPNLSLEDMRGQRVNGNLKEAAIANAPLKRVARMSRNSDSFRTTAFRLGLRRLRIASPY
ncbi:MAG: hypothetical protein Q7R82_02710 [Candidatus Daviesbacteria bacterium]|nr:hypothetical protein [Candidatus Daviesbacteria bacterium]